MSMKLLSGSVAAAWLACGLAAAAQVADKPITPAVDQASPGAAITVAGCVQKETSVLKSKMPAAGAAAEVGMSDEFVLTNALLNPKTSSLEPKPDVEPPPDAPVGTSGSPGNFGKVYRATGAKENDLKAFVGQRVEITGTFKHDDDAKAELGAVGTSGRIVVGELTAANTPEITITAIKPVAGSCPGGAAK